MPEHIIGMVSLGCAKNQVNSEQMIYLLRESGHIVSAEIEECDVVIVNTCGFIESAKSEAIETILEFCSLKSEGRLKKVIVTGCLPERYRSELLAEMPEIDALVGTSDYQNIADAVAQAFSEQVAPRLFGGNAVEIDEVPRELSTPSGWAFLKIAEGCDNRCAYCVIPLIRGAYRSREFNNIVKEANLLAASGVKEIILIAQDTTRYGLDLYGSRRLPELLTELCKIEGIEWIRLHYIYPDDVTDELIGVIASESKIVKYLDIPIQHIDDVVLKKMNRRGDSEKIKELFRKLRERIPGVVLRSTVITGLPGEGEPEFERLCGFLREAKIERAGVFPYSPEEGTSAFDMPERAHFELAEHRAALVSDLQARIMDEYNESRLGTECGVLVEGYDKWGECWFGRSYAEAPDVDGKIFISAPSEVKRLDGEIVRVRITGILDGDLLADLIMKETYDS